MSAVPCLAFSPSVRVVPIAAARVEADAGPHEGDRQDPRQQAGAPAGAQQVTRHGCCVDGAARHTGDGNTANHLGSGRHARLRAAVTPVGVAGVATGHRVRRRYKIRGRNRLVVRGLKKITICFSLLPTTSNTGPDRAVAYKYVYFVNFISKDVG